MLRWRYLKMSFIWWFGLIWAAVGTPFFIIGVCTYKSEFHFRAHSVSATATVVEKGHDTNSKGDSHYWMRYVYHDPAGAEQVGLADLSWKAWRKYNDGDALQITYLSENPARSRVNDEDAGPWWVAPLIFSALGLAFGGVGWFLVIRAIVKTGQEVRLLRFGVPALGRVKSVEINMQVKINNRNPYYLMYEFKDDSGTMREGRSNDLPLRLQDDWQAGDAILVLYDQFDPSQHEVDIFNQRPDDLAMLKSRMPAARSA